MLEIDNILVKRITDKALMEDIGQGDITTSSIVAAGQMIEAQIVAKDIGVIAGLPLVEQVFKTLSQEIIFNAQVKEGQKISNNEIVAVVSGPAEVILSGERVALNFLQRLSGIASITAQYVASVADYSAKIVDTRKTTPGLRVLEKYAVRAGGGYNHRFGLHDMILIKDNHIKAAGGIVNAVTRARKHTSPYIKIEVEVENINQVYEALSAKADVIMLDNMTNYTMEDAVKVINGRALVEASGCITLERVRGIAETGVDLISVGALTHSVKALDLSLNLVK